MEALAVAIGGALGSVCRWGIGGALRSVAPALTLGTFAANVAVCLVAVWLGARLGASMA